MSDVATGEGIARHAGHEGDRRSGSSELWDTQTANTPKQSQDNASMSSSIGTERDNSTTVPKLDSMLEESQTINGVTAPRSIDIFIEEEKLSAQEGAVPSLRTLSARVSITWIVHRA